MYTQSKETLKELTPAQAHQILVDGNKRFYENERLYRNPHDQILHTSHSQYPFAAILSCIDSRVPIEIVFDQCIGDVFSVRVAGNIVNEDVLGSMEYACKVVGSKIIVVVGHTKCGAVTAACNHVELGNITALLDKIQPAVKQAGIGNGEILEADIEKVSELNVHHSIELIRKNSLILAELEQAGEIEIVGAVYDVSSGMITFL